MSRNLNLIFICSVAALGGFLFGFDTAVISGVVGFVKSEFAISAALEGWFVSCALLGCITGVIGAGRISDRYGRKKTLFLSAFFFTVSAVGCMVAKEFWLLICFRFIGGVGIGTASMISPMYISEISPAKLRGRLVTVYQLAITLGILAAYFSNATLLEFSLRHHFTTYDFILWILKDHVWRGMLGMGTIPAVIFFLCLFFVPESPRWLFMIGREAEAAKLLEKLNGKANASVEIESIKESFLDRKSGLKELLSPVFRKALLIGILLPFLSQASGINAVIYYGPRILDEAGFTLSNALGGQVSIGIINVIFTVLAVLLVDKWGRRPLLMLGVTLVVLALFLVGIFFRMEIIHGSWILIFILVYIASFAFSFGPVSWVVISEIFPTSLRGLGMTIGTFTLWTANFFIGQVTPTLLDKLGPSYTFWIFAVLCSPTIWLAWKVIPETRGKSLEEIESYWKRRYYKT